MAIVVDTRWLGQKWTALQDAFRELELALEDGDLFSGQTACGQLVAVGRAIQRALREHPELFD